MRPLLILMCLVSSVFAGTTDDEIPDARYLDYARQFSGFTAKIVVIQEGGELATATAVCIADHWALTAAHVVDKAAATIIMSGTTGHAASDVIQHEQWADVHAKHDIALVRVSVPFGLPWYPPLATETPKEGAVCLMAGYGAVGNMAAGYGQPDGNLRAGTLRMTGTEGHLLVCKLSRGTPLPFGISPGDSGGPMLVDGQLAGVASCIMSTRGPAKARYGDESGHTDVARFRPWILSTMAKQ